MGLLERAQSKKQKIIDETFEEEFNKDKSTGSGLLKKAQQKKESLQKTKENKEKIEEKPKIESAYKRISIKKEGEKDIEVIEEKKGFGWKGLGSRQIVFDHSINEVMYLVSEPILNKKEQKIKNELVRLFKMLADINVTSMDFEEKIRFLEETLEQIIKDNDLNFRTKDELEGIIPQEKSKSFAAFKNKYKIKREAKKIQKKLDKKKPKERKSKDKITKLTPQEQATKDMIFYHIFREFIGYGRIDILMDDQGIEDISCDGYHVPIFLYHKKYEAITTNIQFESPEELDSFVVRLSQICGKQISIFAPIVDGKLPDGSRLQTTLSKTVTKSSTFTIRRFRDNPLTPIDLLNFKSMSTEMAAYFWMVIENNSSILFCGGTASGKTTALNALSLFIPAAHKIVTIEDTREINLPHKNWIAGTTRKGFSATDDKTGKDIDMFDLIRAALRQRPRVIMVGEVRGKEAYSLFQAMATGHTSYATVHASTIHTLIQRLENPPISLPRALLTSLDVIVFQNAVNIGGKMVRRMTSVTEVIKLDPDTNQLIFMEPFTWVSKTDDRFENSGSSKILNNVRLLNDWSEERLAKEMENRILILEWMKKKEIKDYKDVGKIVADYHKYPEELIKKIKEDMM